jgi:hypothetical protein
MIDDLVLVMEIDPPEGVLDYSYMPFEWKGFKFAPNFRSDLITCYTSSFRNLRLKMNQDKLIISGSFHKFYHRQNYEDYTWEEIGLTVDQLLEVFGEPFLKARITKLTFACNLPIDPKPIISKIKAIKGFDPSEMLGGTNHRSYGKYYRMTDYRYKVYDKQTEVVFHDKHKIGPVLRIEKEIKMNAARARVKNPIRIMSPIDLIKPEFYTYCIQELTDLVRSLEFVNSIQISDMDTSADLEAFLFMNDLEVRARYKKLVTYKTYSQKKKRFDNLIASYNPTDWNDFLDTKICDKISELAGDLTFQKTG